MPSSMTQCTLSCLFFSDMPVPDLSITLKKRKSTLECKTPTCKRDTKALFLLLDPKVLLSQVSKQSAIRDNGTHPVYVCIICSSFTYGL